MRTRIKRAVTEFIDVSGRSDREIVELLRSLPIDIAIDLAGHTRGGRLNVFARRVAPIQVSYLGFQNVNFLPQSAGTVGFQLQWQPFDWGYKKHRIAELKATTEQKATTERDVEQRVLLDVEEKFRKLGEARILLDALTDQREAEQTKLGEVKNRYNQKAALLSDLSQQQAAVSQAEAQYQQALAGFWTARANFEKAIGME